MRFKFCGDMDCPDWVLAQIQVLSRLTSIKLKILVQEIIRVILQRDLRLAKLQSLTSNAKFDDGDVRAVTAAVEFIISSSAKHNTDGDMVSNELQQLGLPREHAVVVSKLYSEKKDSIRIVLKNESLRISKLEQATAEVKQGIQSDKYSIDMPFVEVNLRLKDDGNGTSRIQTVCLTRDKLNDLISQLQEVRDLMSDTIR